jgi:hypothetical protein
MPAVVIRCHSAQRLRKAPVCRSMQSEGALPDCVLGVTLNSVIDKRRKCSVRRLVYRSENRTYNLLTKRQRGPNAIGEWIRSATGAPLPYSSWLLQNYSPEQRPLIAGNCPSNHHPRARTRTQTEQMRRLGVSRHQLAWLLQVLSAKCDSTRSNQVSLKR